MDSLKWFSELLLHTTAHAHSDMKTAMSKRSNPENQQKELLGVEFKSVLDLIPGTLLTGHAGWLKSSRSEHCDPPTPSFSFLTCAAAGTKEPPTTRLGEAGHDCGAVFVTADKARGDGGHWTHLYIQPPPPPKQLYAILP
ncbi:hypothetical protein U0070_007171 [Myodes glareolus]|uniref:Uncharacterized protein n=1 Tax=Myodes glareolus TaxID=447135 RepID=A0AAW0HJ00_MYOGA